MNSKLITLLLLVTLMLVSSENYAQKWDGGIMLGVNGYQGDLDKFVIPTLKQSRPAGGLFLRRNFNNNFSLRGNVAFAKLSADDKHFTEPTWRPKRGFSFTSPLTEVSLQGEFQLIREKKKLSEEQVMNNARSKRRIVPYAILGAGLAFVKPTTNYNNATPNPVVSATLINEDKNRSNSNVNFVLPMGGGFRMNLSNKLALGAEVAVRPTFSDYIDGVSASGNSKRKDWYATGLLTLSRTFGEPDQDGDGVADSKDQCPSVKGLSTLSGCPDSDGDSVSDGIDACPDVPGKKSLKGCPDADNDGVADSEDECPDVAGDMKGCPDSDKDGVADKKDKCPKEAGDPSHDGCPFSDRDKDGIADAEDVCPDLPGETRYAGCPDNDKDGIADDKDDCPTKPGPLNLKGCPDADNDGISDPNDDCPSVAGTAANKGCPVNTKSSEIITKTQTPTPVETKILETNLGFIKKVYFTTSKSFLAGDNLRTMEEVLNFLNNNPNYDMKISGHTDNTGANPANKTLSEGRAKSCFEWFKQRGIYAKRMSFNGFAAEKPDAQNTTESGRALNRRVEFEVYKRK